MYSYFQRRREKQCALLHKKQARIDLPNVPLSHCGMEDSLEIPFQFASITLCRMFMMLEHECIELSLFRLSLLPHHLCLNLHCLHRLGAQLST